MSTQPPAGRAWVEVNLAHLVANARTVQAAARGARLLPMVKADAYGLGAAAVVRALEPLDPWGYGVATLDEGIALREAGIQRPILVLTPPQAGERAAYAARRLTAVLDRAEVAAQWRLPYHVEVDTGMARCGVRWDDRAALRSVAGRFLEGAFTHLYAADERPETVGEQWARFHRAIAAMGSRPPLLHVANSAGAWRLAERLDLVRPGIFLYGGPAAPDLPAPLPVVSVRARVVSLRTVPAGESVSYGGDWVAERPTRIVTVAIGYADGVSRVAAGPLEVIVSGRRRPVVGRVTMDFLMVAVGDDDRVAVGDIVTLVGRDGDAEVGIAEFATWSGTNAYEVLARLGPRLPRRYVGP